MCRPLYFGSFRKSCRQQKTPRRLPHRPLLRPLGRIRRPCLQNLCHHRRVIVFLQQQQQQQRGASTTMTTPMFTEPNSVSQSRQMKPTHPHSMQKSTYKIKLPTKTTKTTKTTPTSPTSPTSPTLTTL